MAESLLTKENFLRDIFSWNKTKIEILKKENIIFSKKIRYYWTNEL